MVFVGVVRRENSGCWRFVNQLPDHAINDMASTVLLRLHVKFNGANSGVSWGGGVYIKD